MNPNDFCHGCGKNLYRLHLPKARGLKSPTLLLARQPIWRPPTAENDSPLPAFITPKSRALQSRRLVCRLPLTWVLRGEFSPSPAAIHQSFSLWFPRCCVASAWKCLPPFKSTAAFARRALSCSLLRGARPRRREQYGRAAPARRGLLRRPLGRCVRRLLPCSCRGRFSPSLSRFSSPLGKRKREACGWGLRPPQLRCSPGFWFVKPCAFSL